MSWNPNQGQGQDPNQPSQYGGYGTPPQQPTDPYSQPNQPGPQGQPGGYQQGPYQQGPQNPYGPGQQQQYSGYQPPVGSSPQAGQSGASSLNMPQNNAAGLAYLGWWITGLIFFLMEKQNRFIRFHAMQSMLFFGGLTVLEIALNIVNGLVYVPFLGFCLYGLIGLVWFVGWIVLMINGFQGKYFKLPIIGDIAERYANQGIPGIPGV